METRQKVGKDSVFGVRWRFREGKGFHHHVIEAKERERAAVRFRIPAAPTDHERIHGKSEGRGRGNEEVVLCVSFWMKQNY